MIFDITLVSSARPELLKETLRSLAEKSDYLGNAQKVFCNIDTAYGDRKSADLCETIIRETFADPVIVRPDTNGLGRAIARLWVLPTAPWVLHLEDDWEAVEALPDWRQLKFADERISSLLFLHDLHKNAIIEDPDWTYYTRVASVRQGLTTRKTEVNRFGTSPRFVRAGFARRFAQLIDPSRDPEEQVHYKRDELFKHCCGYRNGIFRARDGGILLKDIGRDWRSKRDMEKNTQG